MIRDSTWEGVTVEITKVMLLVLELLPVTAT